MKIEKIKNLISTSKHLIAFTGAGISVESGVPPFRGENGIWNKYDPKLFDLDFFTKNPTRSWELLKDVFFKFIGIVEPNEAHYALSKLEKNNFLKAIITQNIDNLHHKAGNKNIIEFHGNTRDAICQRCNKKYEISKINLKILPPKCPKCKNILKPDFVFFGEQIPAKAYKDSITHTYKADVVIIIGTTGAVFPAAQLPIEAKKNGATIIEINISESKYTEHISDYFLQGKASEMMELLVDK